MSDYSEQLRVAAHAAKEAGKLLRDLFDKAHTVKEKSKFEGFVTEADLASEKIILSRNALIKFIACVKLSSRGFLL